MPVSDSVRRTQFGAFVRRVLGDAKARGMTVREVERVTGIAKSTIYRWRNGEWVEDPQVAEVRQFCERLDVPFRTAAAVLRWSNDGAPPTVEPDPDPDLVAVMRRLHDPTVSQEEKLSIRATLQYLARGGK